MKNSEIIQRYDIQFQQRRSNFDIDANLIATLIAPIRAGKFYESQTTEAEVTFRYPEVLDSTARKSAGILAASLQGAMLPTGVKWFDLLFRDDAINEDKEAKEWIESCARRMFLAMEDSKFQLAAEESIREIVDFGNTVMILEEVLKDGVYKGLDYTSVPIREIYFDENYKGGIEVLYRRLQWTPIQIMSKFPEEDVPDTVKQKAIGEESQNKMDLIFCIYPRNEIDPDTVKPPVAAINRPYGYKYVLHETQETVGEEGGYYEFPAFLARWGKTSGSKWGWGPGHIALPDVRTANMMVKDDLAYREKIVDPPSLVSERNIFGSLDLSAGGVTIVQDINGIRPYESGAHYNEAQMSLENLQKRIEDHYMVNELQLKDSPRMTATETVDRREQILKMYGPMRSRFQSELLDENLQRTFNIMYRNGQFLEAPDIVIQSAGQIDVKYTSPMARAQRAEEIVSVERWVGFIANLSEIFPDMRDIPNTDAIAIEAADLLNVPAKMRNSEAEIKKTRADRKEQQAQALAAQQAQEQGAGMEAMGKGEEALRAVE